jgi:hypothetical protein
MRLRLIILLITLVGIGIFSYSLTIPYYFDQEKADELLLNSGSMDKKEYYKKESELRTNKIKLMDAGAGIALAGAAMFLFLLFTRTLTFSGMKEIETLDKTSIFISANIVWLLMLPGTYWYYGFRGSRGDYPPFADSIAIPLMTQIPFYLYLMIPLNIFLIVTSIKSNLPAKLFITPDKYERNHILWEIFFGFWIILNQILLISFIVDGDHFSIFVNLFFSYVLLTLRAGQLSKKAKVEVETIK